MTRQLSERFPSFHFDKSFLKRLKLNCRVAGVSGGGLIAMRRSPHSFSTVIRKPSVLRDYSSSKEKLLAHTHPCFFSGGGVRVNLL